MVLTIEESKSLWGRDSRTNDLTRKPRIKLSHRTLLPDQVLFFSPKKEGNREYGFVMYDTVEGPASVIEKGMMDA